MSISSSRSHHSSSTTVQPWEDHLWDRQNEIDHNIIKSTDNLDKISKFLKEYANIEAEYCKQASKLIDKYLRPYNGKQGTALEAMQSLSSLEKAFVTTLESTKLISTQHKTFASQIDEEIIKNANSMADKNKHKRIQKDIKTRQKTLGEKQKSVEGLEQSFKGNCQKCVKQKELYMQKDADINTSRADVLHAQQLYQRQTSEMEQIRMTYWTLNSNFREKKLIC